MTFVEEIGSGRVSGERRQHGSADLYSSSDGGRGRFVAAICSRTCAGWNSCNANRTELLLARTPSLGAEPGRAFRRRAAESEAESEIYRCNHGSHVFGSPIETAEFKSVGSRGVGDGKLGYLNVAGNSLCQREGNRGYRGRVRICPARGSGASFISVPTQLCLHRVHDWGFDQRSLSELRSSQNSKPRRYAPGTQRRKAPWKWRPVESVENSKTKSEFSTLSTGLGNPARGGRISTFPPRRRRLSLNRRKK